MTAAVATDLTANNRRRERRYLCWFAGAMVLLTAAAFTLQWQNGRNERALEVAYDLQLKGGQVYFPPSLIDCIQEIWNTGEWTWRTDTNVLLGDEIDGQWLRAHEFLADIEINRLSVYTDAQETDAILRLIEIHPLTVLSVSWRSEADAIADALATKSDLQLVTFSDSGLTDTGLGRLPLEQLQGIAVDGTNVTANGLDELRRCQQLEVITLDGNQFTAPVAEILASMPRLQRLELNRPGVTGGLVRLLGKLQQLRFLYLRDQGITDEGIEVLDESLPGCVIEVAREI